MSGADESLREARTHLSAGNPAEAYRALRPIFEAGPDPLTDDTLFARAIGALAELARVLGPPPLARPRRPRS